LGPPGLGPPRSAFFPLDGIALSCELRHLVQQNGEFYR